MTLEAGTIAFWRDFEPGHDKFINILGTNRADDVLSFTISSQTKYLTMQPHANEMVEIGVLRFPNSGIWSGVGSSTTVHHCPNLPWRSIIGSRTPDRKSTRLNSSH